MAVSIGPRIGVDGEAEYRKQLSALITQTKTFKAEMQGLTSEFGKNGASLSQNKQQQKMLQDQIARLKDGLKEQKDMLEKCTQEYGETDARTLKYKQSVAQTEAEISKLSAELKSIPSQLELVGNKMKSVGDSMTNVGKTMSMKVTAPIVGMGAVAVNTFAGFQSGMKTVEALSGETGKNLKKLEDAAKDWGTTTLFHSTQVAEGYKYMALAGWDANDMLSGAKPILDLATASEMDLARASDIVTDNLSAFNMKTEEAKRLADAMAFAQANANTSTDQLGEAYKNVAATSTQMGYAFEETTAALMVMADSGIKGGEAGTALSSIMTRLGNNISGSRDLLQSFGVEVYDSAGNVKSLSSILQGTKEVWGSLNDEQKANISFTVAGKTAQSQFMTMMGDSEGNFLKYAEGLRNSSGAAAEMASIMGSGLSGDLTKLKNNAMELANEFGENLAPAVSSISGFLKNVTQAFRGLDERTQNVILVVAGVAAAIGPLLVIGGMLTSSIGSIISFVGMLTPVLTGAGIAAGGASTGILAFTAPLLPIIAIIGGVVAAGVLLYKNWDTIKEKATALGGTIKEKWNELKTKTAETFNSVKENVSNAGNTLVLNTKETLGNMKQAWDENGGGIAGLAGALGEGVIGRFNTMHNTLDSLTGGALTKLEGKFGISWDGIVNGARSKLGNITGVMANIQEKIKGAFSDVINKALSWGKDMIQGFVDGIKSKIDAVKNSAKSIANTVKSFLHFSRPDEGPLRDYETWMPDMVDGLSRTLVASKGKMERALSLFTGDMADQINPAVSVGTGGYGGNITINVYPDPGMDENALVEKMNRMMAAQMSRQKGVFA